MFTLLSHTDAPAFFARVREVRTAREDWNLLEIGILREKTAVISVEQVGAKLKKIFSDVEGMGMVCNARDIIGLVKWGRHRPPTDLCARISHNLPENACYVNVEPMTLEGVSKIQIRLMHDPQEVQAKTIAQKRHSRAHPVFVIATGDNELKGAWSELIREHGMGRAFLAGDLDQLLLSNLEVAPNMILWDVDTVNTEGMVFYNMVMEQDPQACVVAVGETMDVRAVMKAKNAGVMEFVKKPLDGKTLGRLISASPLFGSWKTT